MFYLDHFLSFTNSKLLEDHLQFYKSLGFQPMERTVRHNEGLRTGFIGFGYQYIEFLWVEEREMFETEASDQRKATERDPAMVTAAILVEDIEKARTSWIANDFDIGEIEYRRPRDAPETSDPLWGFLNPPEEDYGINLFCLTYLPRSTGKSKVRDHPNKIFGIAGLTFVSGDVSEKMATWMDVFDIHNEEDDNIIEFGPYFIRWLTPEDYQGLYNLKHDNKFSDLAMIHLLTENLAETKKYLLDNVSEQCETSEGLIVKPSDQDGFRFHITEADKSAYWHNVKSIQGTHTLFE